MRCSAALGCGATSCAPLTTADADRPTASLSLNAASSFGTVTANGITSCSTAADGAAPPAARQRAVLRERGCEVHRRGGGRGGFAGAAAGGGSFARGFARGGGGDRRRRAQRVAERGGDAERGEADPALGEEVGHAAVTLQRVQLGAGGAEEDEGLLCAGEGVPGQARLTHSRQQQLQLHRTAALSAIASLTRCAHIAATCPADALQGFKRRAPGGPPMTMP